MDFGTVNVFCFTVPEPRNAPSACCGEFQHADELTGLEKAAIADFEQFVLNVEEKIGAEVVVPTGNLEQEPEELEQKQLFEVKE